MRNGTIWVTAAVVLGLGLRGYHYFRNPPVWLDEGAVVANVLDKDYLSLLGALDHHQAAPPLYLWVEKAAVDVLGDGPLALRLPSFLVSCAAMLLIVPLARRVLPPPAVPWAVLLFACSEEVCQHSYEIKPYAFDVFAATALAYLYGWRDRLGLPRLLLVLAALAPPLLWVSYPACFLYGGVGVALLPAVWRDRRPRTVAAYALLAAAVGVAFLLLTLGPVRAQEQDPELVDCWTHTYPQWDRPWTVPLWSLLATLEVGRYNCKPLGQGVMLLAVVGGYLLWRDGRRDEVVLLALPLGLALLAAGLHRYPVGGYRLTLFLAPAMLVLAARPVPPALSWLTARGRLLAAPLAAFLLLPVGVAFQRAAQPWPVADTRAAAAFVAAHYQPGDPIAGNDWTHLYYFRRLGGAYRSVRNPPAVPGNRLWVVWNQPAPPETRFHSATALAPPGWRVAERFDADQTTTVLFTRPE